MRPSPPSTAIIGAGIAGLACARALHSAAYPATLYEKSRDPGGRLASRQMDEATLDLGAQFFSVRHDSFRREAMAWLTHGVAAPWPRRLWRVEGRQWQYRHDDRERYCGQPGAGQGRLPALFPRPRALQRQLARAAGGRRLALGPSPWPDLG
ncbi:MAG: NAD(P)-binding protein [Halomonas sp.]|nr:NAD(P)-binding protein [Halomonas sp.]